MVLELLTITFNIWPGGDCQLRKQTEGRKKERLEKYFRVVLAPKKEGRKKERKLKRKNFRV
jgi:hypothetical protein